jgi:hypothetical protein
MTLKIFARMILSLSLSTLGAFSAQAANHRHDRETSNAATVSDAERAFEKIKSLAGTWEGVLEGNQKTTVTYEVASEGQSVIARVFGMVDVYHLDGNRLMVTHYCSLGNQPRLVATPPASSSEVTELDFKFLDISNLRPEQKAHISGLKLRMTGDGSLIQRWQDRNIESGQESSFDLPLTRVKK